MSAGEERQAALVPAQSASLTQAGAKSLAARGRADLRINEEAEEWLKRGVEFYWQQQYEDAFRCFERGIQLNPNDPKLQTNLGYAYFKGEGVPKDCAQAACWYRKAAERGNPEAQFSLGALYDLGQGVPRDYAQAEYWYRRAADQGM